MIAAEDAVETSIYLANAPECCSGAEQFDNMLQLLGASVEDEEMFHDEEDHLGMTM